MRPSCAARGIPSGSTTTSRTHGPRGHGLSRAIRLQYAIRDRRARSGRGALGHGPFFRSPFPDYYAMNHLFLRARSIVVDPHPTVVIGVSPRSYGFFPQQQPGDRRTARSFRARMPAHARIHPPSRCFPAPTSTMAGSRRCESSMQSSAIPSARGRTTIAIGPFRSHTYTTDIICGVDRRVTARRAAATDNPPRARPLRHRLLPAADAGPGHAVEHTPRNPPCAVTRRAAVPSVGPRSRRNLLRGHRRRGRASGRERRSSPLAATTAVRPPRALIRRIG